MLEKPSHRNQPQSTQRQNRKTARIFNQTTAITSLVIGCLVSAGMVGLVQGQKAALRQKATEVKQQLQTDPVAGLVLAIQATGQNRANVPWKMLPEVQASLLHAVQTARERNRFEQPSPVYTATFTPDGQQVATAGKEGNIYLWNFQDAQNQILKGNGQPIGSIQFSPDGAAVFGNPIAEDGAVQFWKLQDNTDYLPSPNYLLSAAFSADGQMQVSGNTNGRVQLWNRQGERIANLHPRQSGSITAVAFEGSSIVSGGTDGNLTLWNAKGNLLGRLWAGAKVTSMGLDQGGQRIISQDLNRQQAFIWDAQANRWNQFLLGETSTAKSATLNPDNTLIAKGMLDGQVQISPLNAQSNQVLPQAFQGHQGAVNTVKFSPNGTTVISGGEDGSVRIWDLRDRTLLSKSRLQDWNKTEISPNNTEQSNRVSAHSDGTIHLSDAEGNLIGKFFTGHQTPIQSVGFGKDQKTIISVAQDGEVRVWQASWQGWLETACNRLQYHPILTSPSTREARDAQAICQPIWKPAPTPAQAETTQPVKTAPNALETRVVVKLGERKVYVYQGDQVKASYPIATGKTGWDTPTGTYRVFEMLQNPAWTHPITRQRMQPGNKNPLGSRWIAFWSDESNKIGFHGTPDRNSVGQAVSHGCLRMYDEDAQALYDQVKLGTIVTVEP
jgi:WD40 repeat protein/lipoprotein-anchoring transpeptidase ErfK/SrfK